jgi:hypothetical protein
LRDRLRKWRDALLEIARGVRLDLQIERHS